MDAVAINGAALIDDPYRFGTVTAVGLDETLCVRRIGSDFAQPRMPPEVQRLGRTITAWKAPSVAWHRAHVTNGPTETINNLVKRVKRVAFGFRRFDHYGRGPALRR